MISFSRASMVWSSNLLRAASSPHMNIMCSKSGLQSIARPKYIINLNHRTLSSSSSSTLSIPIPEPPLPPVPQVDLNVLGEPTFASLGLNSYWPSGWYQAALEALHVNFDMPWWVAIATTTVMIRVFLFPFMIKQRRNLAKFTDAMPRLSVLQNQMTNARLSGNHVEMMRISQEMQEFMKHNDVNPFKNLKLLAIQVPIFLSVFTGLRGMTSLPVASLQTGGIGWFVDLTATDPYYLLPLLSMTSILLMFETGSEMSTSHVTPAMKLMMRGFPIVGFLMVMNMPSALLWYWTISNTISVTQAMLLRIPTIRDFFKLPIIRPPPKAEEKKRGFVEGFRETMTNSRLLAEIESRERLDAKAWQKAGAGAAPRTFSYDPTQSRTKTTISTKGTIVEDSESYELKKKSASSRS